MARYQNKQTNQNDNYQTGFLTQVSLGSVGLTEVKRDSSVYKVQYALDLPKKEHTPCGVSQAFLVMKDVTFLFLNVWN